VYRSFADCFIALNGFFQFSITFTCSCVVNVVIEQ
jgi:hypothetical protein